jgi:hypothetical protein
MSRAALGRLTEHSGAVDVFKVRRGPPVRFHAPPGAGTVIGRAAVRARPPKPVPSAPQWEPKRGRG